MPQTSFIPKRTAIDAAPRKMHSNVSVFLLISIIVFLIVSGLSVGMFFYHGILVTQIVDKNEQLVRAKDAFEVTFIEDVVKLSRRIDASKELLNQHTALTPLLRLLEDRTLATVRFTNFSFNAKDGQEAVLTLKGEARSFNSVALQSDVFAQEKSFQDQVFSNFNLDQSGNVTFQFKTMVSPKFLLYRNIAANSGGNQ